MSRTAVYVALVLFAGSCFVGGYAGGRIFQGTELPDAYGSSASSQGVKPPDETLSSGLDTFASLGPEVKEPPKPAQEAEPPVDEPVMEAAGEVQQ